MAGTHEKDEYGQPPPDYDIASGKSGELPQPDDFEDLNPLSSDIEIPRKIEDEPARMVCSCGEVFFVPLAFSGNAATCPNCHAEVKLPEENFIRTTCVCGKSFKIPCVLAGKSGKCPQCGRQIKIQETPAVKIFLDEPSHGARDKKMDEALLDKQLNDIAGILLKGDLKKPHGRADAPKQKETPKKTENIYVGIDCSCGEKIMVPITVSHRQIKCPQCGNAVKLPEDNFIRMNCVCGTTFKVPRVFEGKSGVCPKCGKRLKISGTQQV